MTKKPIKDSYLSLIGDIGKLLEQGRAQAIKRVNTILVETYWQVGKSIVEFEQAGNLKAEYGKELLLRLSKDLKNRYGKGFSRSNLQYMRLLYTHYPNRQTLSGKLSWSHYVELLSISDDTGAISPDDVTQTDRLQCLICFACVKICPEGARQMNEPNFQSAIQALQQSCQDRKEPEIFF